MAILRLPFEAVVFDCDGVLVDSAAAVDRAWRQLADEFDLPLAAMLPEIHGVRAVDTLARWMPPDRVDGAARRLEDIEVALVTATTAVPGSQALVRALDGRPWAVATSGSRRLATARLAAAGFPDPPVLVTADDVERGKPHPDPYLAAAAGLGLSAAATVVFEDAPSGAAAAEAAGATVIAVATSYPPGAFPALATVTDLRQVTVEAGVLVLALDPSEDTAARR